MGCLAQGLGQNFAPLTASLCQAQGSELCSHNQQEALLPFAKSHTDPLSYRGLCYFVAVSLGTKHAGSLNLCFVICEMGRDINLAL